MLFIFCVFIRIVWQYYTKNIYFIDLLTQKYKTKLYSFDFRNIFLNLKLIVFKKLERSDLKCQILDG